MLDLEKSRRITYDEVKAQLSAAEGKIGVFQENMEKLSEGYEPPEKINDLDDFELTEAVYQTSRMYGMWKRISTSATFFKKAMNRIEEMLRIVLSRQVYVSYSSEELKTKLLEDREYEKLQGLYRELEEVIGIADGESSAWFNLNESIKKVASVRERMSRAKPR